MHRYGAHLFHTPNEKVWRYLNRFAGFNAYRHRGFTTYAGQVYPLPIILARSANTSAALHPRRGARLIAGHAAEIADRPQENLEEKAIAMVGRPLYEAFIRGYTAKQWQTDPRDLPPQIISRLPVSYTFDDRYFNDRFQGQPLDGYAAIFKKMLANPLIETKLGVDFFALKADLPSDLPVVFTGPIDCYFDFAEGELGWRTVDFENEVVATGDFQGTAIMNYADETVPYTRILEFRHFNPERSYQTESTLIAREYSRFAGRGDEPYYPINAVRDKAIYARYQARAAAEKNVHFGGRLGTYRYLDMHQAIAIALKAFETVLGRGSRAGKSLQASSAS